MRICDFKIFNYHVPLSRELPIAGAAIKQREGFILKLSDESGNTGFGETAPLHGVSTEMSDVVLMQLKQLRDRLNGQMIPSHIGLKNVKFSAWLENMPLSPSVHFGLETAILSLIAANTKKYLAHLLNENYQETIPINGLLQGPRESILSEAEALLEQGYKTLKVKVGHAKIHEDINTVNALTKLINNRAILRLDANRAWSLEQALEFSKAIEFAVIEYIEEPLKDFSKISEFYEETLIPVAIDESLKEHSLREIKSLDGLEVVILKPTILGGFEKIAQMTQEAHSYGLRTVITSSFETGIGLRALANLAASFSKHIPVGLDTAKWLIKDTVTPHLKTERGRLNIENCQLNNLHLDTEQIHELH
ncbi:MAG: o-succinylbenzoate synthase [Candidatus Omnitrophica bacterium]|nr:o-succinylbenzoate synthase [Candidatus Omnitrophota bacterium]